MTKAELIEAIKAKLAADVATNHIHEKTVIDAVVTALGDVAGEALAAGKELTLPGIGKLEVRARNARMGRNPKTGAPLEIAASKAVGLKPAKALKDRVNK